MRAVEADPLMPEAEATLTEAEAALKSVQTAAIDSDPAARLNRYRRTAGAV